MAKSERKEAEAENAVVLVMTREELASALIAASLLPRLIPNVETINTIRSKDVEAVVEFSQVMGRKLYLP